MTNRRRGRTPAEVLAEYVDKWLRTQSRAQAAEAAVANIEALHTRVPCECTKCNARRLEGLDDELCSHCTDLVQSHRDGGIRWPCPTITAIRKP